MPTQVSVQLKREGGSWTVNGYKEVDGADSSSTNSSLDYDDLSLSSDLSTYSDFLFDDKVSPLSTCNHAMEVEAIVTLPRKVKALTEVTNLTNKTQVAKKSTQAAKTSNKKITLKRTVSKKVSNKKQKEKKGDTTATRSVKSVIKPQTKSGNKTSTSIGTRAALPGETFEDWLVFGDSGNYSLSSDDWSHVRGWTTIINKNKDFAAEAITFHQLVVKMKCDLGLQSARDCWSDVLPEANESNYPLCVLVLMLCTPMVPDTKIIDVFRPFFKENKVDEDWIIQEGETGIAQRLRSLGRQNDSAKYVVQAAIRMKELSGLPRDYRDLVGFIGAGPKVALVTLQEAIGSVQGVPCDVHMCRIFSKLGWIPASIEADTVVSFISNNKKEQHNYELCRASIEGWFPKKFWHTLNQTWAGLGQLLNESASKQIIAQYIDAQVSDYNSPWRVADKKKFVSIMAAYNK